MKAGYAGLINIRNRYGQVVRTTYYDADWKPVRNDEFQYATIKYEYDNKDADSPPNYEAYYDKDGKPCESIDGYYARRMTYSGPQNNLLTSEMFLNAVGGADISVASGAHRVEYHYNGSQMQTSVRFFDENGLPFQSYKGFASKYCEYNFSGSLLWEVYYNASGDLVSAGGHFAAQSHCYDYSGHHTGEKYFSSDRLALTQSEGYASIYYTYDEAGNIVSISYYNAVDEPVLVNGSAKIEREYDKHHHLIFEAFFGTDLQPVMIRDGYAVRKMVYDIETGLLKKTEYLDTEGNPVPLREGYASYEQKYDANGNLLLRAYYDETGDPVVPASVGYARFERKCDINGNVLEEAYYDADNSLIILKDQYCVLAQEYNANGVLSAITYLGQDRLPVNAAFGYARKEMTYDYLGNITSEAYYNAELEPVSIPSGSSRT